MRNFWNRLSPHGISGRRPGEKKLRKDSEFFPACFGPEGEGPLYEQCRVRLETSGIAH